MEKVPYRMTDAAFLCFQIRGIGGVTYSYGSNDPQATDQPVAIELRLPE